MNIGFSFTRLGAMIVKEFTQIRRDKVTFIMMMGIPLLQLVLFGFAINSNPKNLPTAVVSSDHSPLTRTFITAVQNTDYFQIVESNIDKKRADFLLARGDIQFIITIPSFFTSNLIKGAKPSLLVTADATDPLATVNVLSAVSGLADRVFNLDLSRGLGYLIPEKQQPYELIVHSKYNPEAITFYNTVPGLMGTILTMTMIMATGLAITREFERGTMEGLLSTPIKPFEVIIGKIIPYVLVGYLQQLIIVLASIFVFKVPVVGNIGLLMITTLPFIAANLSVGLTFSTIAKNQLQALQMTFFFFLPSVLLSGFLFPFKGMPYWAQMIGEILPLTHFLRIVRGIMLKGNGVIEIWPQVWPILLFMVGAISLAVLRYRQTLD